MIKHINSLISGYYSKLESDNLYYNKTYINSLISGYYTKTDINDQFQPFNTAFNLARGGGYYYNIPVSTNGIMIWDESSQSLTAQFKLNLSKIYTAIGMTRDLEVNRLSGGVLSQIDNAILSTCYSKSQFDTTIGGYYKMQIDSLSQPLTSDTLNLKRVIYRTLDWTSRLVIKYPQLGALGFSNHVHEVTVLFDTDDLLFFQKKKQKPLLI